MFADMFAATSVLQQQAAEIRNLNPNWSSYLQYGFFLLDIDYSHYYQMCVQCACLIAFNCCRSQMISQDVFDFISAYDVTDVKGEFLNDNRSQAAKAFFSLLEHISKESTIQYVLVLIDDLLTVSSFFSLRCSD